MKVVNQKKLLDFAKKHADAENSISAWRKVVKDAIWKKGSDILDSFPKASLIPSKRARFKIVGNKYRIIVQIDYINEIVDIRFIGTHTEYDKVDAATI